MVAAVPMAADRSPIDPNELNMPSFEPMPRPSMKSSAQMSAVTACCCHRDLWRLSAKPAAMPASIDDMTVNIVCLSVVNALCI